MSFNLFMDFAYFSISSCGINLGKTFYSHLAFLREPYVFVYCKFWLQVDSVYSVYSVYCYVYSNPRLRPTLPSKLKDKPFVISCLLVNSSLCLKITLALSVGGGGNTLSFYFFLHSDPRKSCYALSILAIGGSIRRTGLVHR